MKPTSLFRFLMLSAVAAFAIIAVSFKPVADNPGGIVFFEGTWQQALDKAGKENKIVFLDAYTSWCGPCKFLKSNVFTTELVGSYFNEHFINVEIDMEKGEGKTLARTYNVGAYPSLFFIRPDGSVANKSVGYLTAEQLVEYGESTLTAEAARKP